MRGEVMLACTQPGKRLTLLLPLVHGLSHLVALRPDGDLVPIWKLVRDLQTCARAWAKVWFLGKDPHF